MGSWQQTASGTREHIKTGARNMREHRERKREQAEERNAVTVPERRAETVKWWRKEATPPGQKVSRQARRKRAVKLTAIEAATREWIETKGPGVDF
jgi:hypothetical protein